MGQPIRGQEVVERKEKGDGIEIGKEERDRNRTEEKTRGGSEKKGQKK